MGVFRAAIKAPLADGYAVVFATSHTLRERLSLRAARELLGWEPVDSIGSQNT